MSDSSLSGILTDLALALLELHNYQRISRQLYDTLSKPNSLFDNRATETKPNVYIEIGMSLILKLPFMVCDYRDPQRPEFDPIPSDLGGFLTLRYTDYKSLFTELALKLAGFIYQRVRPIKRPRRT